MATSKNVSSASVLTRPDVMYDWYCQPCSTEDLHLEAAGFCQHCQEYLCDSCCRHHRKSTASRHHIVMDKTIMPKNKITPKVMDTLIETCATHTDKVLEYFCYTHNSLCCSACLNLTHSSCENKKKSYVPNISADIANSKEHKDLLVEFDRLVAMATSVQLDINTDQQDNDNCRSRAISDINEGRQKVDKLLNKIVEDSVQKVNELHQSNVQKIKTASAKCQTALSYFQQMSSYLNEKAKGRQNSQLFVAIKLAQNRVRTIEDELCDVTESTIPRYIIDQDEKVVNTGVCRETRLPRTPLQVTMSALSAMWSLSARQVGRSTQARYLREIMVKTKKDDKDCYIKGIVVLPENRMVVTDFSNSAIKLIDMKRKTVTSRLSLSAQPLDVIRTQPGQVAVPLAQVRKIEIYTVTDILVRSHSVEVPGDEWGSLCYDGQNFILVYPLARAIKKVDMTGKVVSTIFTDNDSDPLFKRPWFITLSRGQAVLYVFDIGANTVTCLTLSGQVVAVYSHVMLKTPRGVAVGADGSVYVCASHGIYSTVHQLAASGKQFKTLLDKDRGLAPGPCAIAHSEDDDTLAISSGSDAPHYCNFVKLFKIE